MSIISLKTNTKSSNTKMYRKLYSEHLPLLVTSHFMTYDITEAGSETIYRYSQHPAQSRKTA